MHRGAAPKSPPRTRKQARVASPASTARSRVAANRAAYAYSTKTRSRQCVGEEVGERDDLVLGRPLRRGRGVILNTLKMYGPHPNTYGHSGAGGSVGFADPDLKLGIGYAMNQMQPGIETDTRGNRLIRAVFDALA